MKKSHCFLSVIAAIMLMAGATQSANAVAVGLGAGLAGATNADSPGSRLNIEGQSTALLAGNYVVNSFEYNASGLTGNVQPFLATQTGADTYSIVWVGPTRPAPALAGPITETFLGQTFSLTGNSLLFAGFNASGPSVRFADPDGASVTDHNNPALFAIIPGSAIGPFTNNNLSRNYAFAVNVSLIPEPATAIMGLLSVGALALRRRRA